jgi:hypothetical protein
MWHHRSEAVSSLRSHRVDINSGNSSANDALQSAQEWLLRASELYPGLGPRELLRQAMHLMPAQSRVQPGGQGLSSVETMQAEKISRLQEEVIEFRAKAGFAMGSWQLTAKDAAKRSKHSYVKNAALWAKNPRELPPKDLRAQAATAVVSMIGPLTIQKRHAKEQLEELESALQGSNGLAINQQTRIEYRIELKKKQLNNATVALDAAFANLGECMLTTAAEISPTLARDRRAYELAMRQLDAAEPGMLQRLTARAEELMNWGELHDGELVMTDIDGSMQQAQVLRRLGEGEYELSVLVEVVRTMLPYENGFQTSQLRVVTRKRPELYKRKTLLQELSSGARAWVSARAAHGSAAEPLHNSVAFLMLLYADAESVLPLLGQLGHQLEDQFGDNAEVVMATLKGAVRATVKALEKYDGDYRQLTDLARMTVKCKTLRTLLGVLEAIADSQVWRGSCPQPLPYTLTLTLTRRYGVGAVLSPYPTPSPSP